MNVLHVSTYHRHGGAAIACRRLHDELNRQGVRSRMLVHTKTDSDPTVISAFNHLNAFDRFRLTQSFRRDGLPLRGYPAERPIQWSINWLPNNLSRVINKLNPDVVHLHWIGNGFMPIQALSHIEAPIVWTLHDMWAFTGGCHHAIICKRYREQCGTCPQLHSEDDNDPSHRGWTRRSRHYPAMTIVTPSQWLADRARKSSLMADMPIHVIPNGLDLERFRPLDRGLACDVFGLPRDKVIILFGAIDSTSSMLKGFTYLKAALHKLAAVGWDEKAVAVVFGAHPEADPPDLGLPTYYTGFLHDEQSMALLYSAADVFVAPSVQDNLPNTVMEAMACGTPSAAFTVGGLPELIAHGETGSLAHPFDTDELARHIAALITADMGEAVRGRAEQLYAIEDVTRRYIDVYTNLR